MLWDIFCKVIDNHGDLGVCWRLAAQLAARGERVRLWIDDASALAWMAPDASDPVDVQAWNDDSTIDAEPGDVVIEAFGCELPQRFQARIAQRLPHAVWINLEYLTAESFAVRNHELASPVLTGPAAGANKYFFYPGFVRDTGGLLRDAALVEARRSFDADRWLRTHNVEREDALCVSLFCYEPATLNDLLLQFAARDRPTKLLVTAGRPTLAARNAIDALDRTHKRWNAPGHVDVTWLPLMTHTDFDHLLWSCDLNFVRGEDSLVRALWAGKPFIWHIYPQHDNAHHDKLHAFLDWLDAPKSLREFHLAWNGIEGAPPSIDLAAWHTCAQSARRRLLEQDDLVSQLMCFIHSHRDAA